jgi:hypothetical protein
MFKKTLKKLRDGFLGPLLLKFDEQDKNSRGLADINFRTRAMFKQAMNKPITVLFVCHEPSLWGMFESVYMEMEADPSFSPVVVVLPYKHGTLMDGQYKDAGMMEFCESHRIKATQGYDKKNNEWLAPASLMPDYVFFQTPYNIFPSEWSANRISLMSRVCYLPYGTTLFKGEVEDIVHPESFMRHIHFIFKENITTKEILVKKFQNSDWFNEKKIILCGFTKLDKLTTRTAFCGEMWRHGLSNDKKRILWTPRWTTSEGTCHFFDYKDFFFEFCKKNHNIDFVFRPHPLCFQNFLQTGQLKDSELRDLEMDYDNSSNMALDKTNEYYDTFLSSDILISDLSSMMLEFLITEKPIVYTHRVDLFNELGRKLSDGFYWVKSSTELRKTLEMLISGTDPLKEKRKELIKNVLYIPEEGSGMKIKEIIGSDFKAAIYTFKGI